MEKLGSMHILPAQLGATHRKVSVFRALSERGVLFAEVLVGLRAHASGQHMQTYRLGRGCSVIRGAQHHLHVSASLTHHPHRWPVHLVALDSPKQEGQVCSILRQSQFQTHTAPGYWSSWTARRCSIY